MRLLIIVSRGYKDLFFLGMKYCVRIFMKFWCCVYYSNMDEYCGGLIKMIYLEGNKGLCSLFL